MTRQHFSARILNTYGQTCLPSHRLLQMSLAKLQAHRQLPLLRRSLAMPQQNRKLPLEHQLWSLRVLLWYHNRAFPDKLIVPMTRSAAAGTARKMGIRRMDIVEDRKDDCPCLCYNFTNSSLPLRGDDVAVESSKMRKSDTWIFHS